VSDNKLSIQQLFEEMQDHLYLVWHAGLNGAERLLLHEPDSDKHPSLIGHLNLIQPNRIQVLGENELLYLQQKQQRHSDNTTLHQLYQNDCHAIIIADDQEIPENLLILADQQKTALFGSALPSHELVDKLRDYLSKTLAKRITIHGVFMEVMGIGLLITGASSIGKSELALELISRGQRLIADDAPEFIRISHDIIEGVCPELLRDFLEVRGLGILNVRAMYGAATIKQRKYLKLIIHLKHQSQHDSLPHGMERIIGNSRSRRVLGVDITEITLPVAPGRNLAVLVETAVRNFLLSENGYNAASDMVARQNRLLNDNGQ